MLRFENLYEVYKGFPSDAVDDGSLKGIELLQHNQDEVTYFMLIEAERFWAASIMQILARWQLEKIWLHSWSDVTLYYAEFFAMNAIMRLAGRAITFSYAHNKVLKIQRTNSQNPEYRISKAGKGHREQWNCYYDLIKDDITDDTVLRELFDVQLDYQHQESWIRQMINYDLQYGFDERHCSSDMLRERSEVMTQLFPFVDTIAALADDSFVEVAKVIYIWKHLKIIFDNLAHSTEFKFYWQLQNEKLLGFIRDAPFEHNLGVWFIEELRSAPDSA